MGTAHLLGWQGDRFPKPLRPATRLPLALAYIVGVDGLVGLADQKPLCADLLLPMRAAIPMATLRRAPDAPWEDRPSGNSRTLSVRRIVP
jgi:hypothetical protein